jgi:hypothetical protein
MASEITDWINEAKSQRLAAVSALMASQVTDETLMHARDAHLFAYADYAAKQPLLAASTPANVPPLYEAVTAEAALNDCCKHLLSAIGLELTYPAEAERLRHARTFMRRPAAAAGIPVTPPHALNQK